MSTQASGYFTVSGNIVNQTVSVVINGITYSQNVTSSQNYQQIAENYSNYLNTQSSFTQYFNSTYSGNNFYINVNAGSIYDGNPGNHVTISSSFSNSVVYTSATGNIDTFALQSPQYGNSTLVLGPFTTTIFVDAYSDQSSNIATTLNANSSFSANFIAAANNPNNFVVYFTTKSTGAYPGALGNGLTLNISPYGSKSGPTLTGGSTTQSLTLLPNNSTLQGGQSSNIENINNFFIDFYGINVQPTPIPSNPLHNINLTNINDELIEFLRIDLYQYLILQGMCPAPLPPIIIEGTILKAFAGDDGIPNFKNGYYYRMPSFANLVNGQVAPKYYQSLPGSYVSFVYPPGNVYNPLMLVKTFQPINGILPNDVSQITQQQAELDLLNLFDTIFAL